MVLSWPNWWALEGGGKPANDLKMLDQLVWMARPLYNNATTIDFCRPDEPLERYDAVVVPSLHLVTEAEGANLVSFVAKGGTAVLSFWSGIVDEHDAVYLGPYGGPLRPLMGCDVLEVAPQKEGDVLEVEWEDGTRTTATFWADVAAEGDGHVLARIASGPWAGRPVVMQTRAGKGIAYYVGARLDNAGLSRVYDRAPALAGGPALRVAGAGAGAGIERVVRSSRTDSFEFIINHSAGEREVEIAPNGFDLLTRSHLGDRLVLSPTGVAIIRRAGAATGG
jgi:beta-galactosidase